MIPLLSMWFSLSPPIFVVALVVDYDYHVVAQLTCIDMNLLNTHYVFPLPPSHFPFQTCGRRAADLIDV